MRYIPIMSGTHAIGLRGVDLNLLRALDALLTTRHVTRAAAAVGVSQSAMSHSLAKLRALLGDPLLVRGRGQGSEREHDGSVRTVSLVPTDRARAIQPRLRDALAELGAILEAPVFDPATAVRRFRVASADYIEIILLRELHARLSVEAPGVDLRFFDGGTRFVEGLAEGRYDVAVAPLPREHDVAGIQARRLVDESFVCVVRRGHPLTRGKLTAERFARATHALIAPAGGEGSFADTALARLGLSRRVAVSVPHFLAAPHLVAGSDLVLTLAARVAAAFADSFGLALLDLPPELKMPDFTLSLLWHERRASDPAHAWFRRLFAEVAAAIPRPRRRPRRGAS
jgi:DNA-binding transcriptional LysR family regulator